MRRERKLLLCLRMGCVVPATIATLLLDARGKTHAAVERQVELPFHQLRIVLANCLWQSASEAARHVHPPLARRTPVEH